MFSVTITKGKEIQGLLSKLPKKLEKKIIRTSVRDSQKIGLAATKQNASSMVGGEMGAAISKDAQLKAFKKQKRGSYGMSIRLRPDDEMIYYTEGLDGGVGKRYYIPFAIEYGHAFPGRGGGKSPPKDVPAIPFMRKAGIDTAPKRLQHFTDKTWDGIEKAMKEQS